MFPSVYRLASKMRAQSPSSSHQYHHSPTRHRSSPPGDDRRAESKVAEKMGCQSKLVKNTAGSINSNSPSQAERNAVKAEITKSCNGEALDKNLNVDFSEKSQSPDRRNQTSSKVDSPDKKTQGNVQGGDKSKGRAHL